MVDSTDTEKLKTRQKFSPRPSTVLRERRRWDRLPLAIPIFVRGADERGNTFMEFTSGFNINRGGMLLACAKPLPQSDVIDLEIPFAKVPWPPAQDQFIRCLKARIVYTAPATGCQLYGLEFTSPLPAPPGVDGPPFDEPNAA